MLSLIVRLLEGFYQSSPSLYPDEYIYSEIGRSLGQGGAPLIRGESSHFPAILEPLITAPFWWIHDTHLAYHAILGFNALVMSMAAIPVYLIGRRIGTSKKLAVTAALLSLASPDLMYTTSVLAEPLAFPLALTAIYFAIVSIAQPRWQWHLGFLVFSGLTVLTRLQFVALPLTYVIAVALFSLRQRTIRRTVRSLAVPLAACLIPPVAVGIVGASRFLGYYKGATTLNGSPLAYLVSAGRELLVLGYTSGWVLIPGALLALALALWRPRNREELAFACVTGVFIVSVLGEAAIYGVTGRVQERYFFYLVPLIGLAFTIYVQRGWPFKPAQAVLAAALLMATFASPELQFVSDHNNDGSPFLLGMHWVMASFFIAGRPLLILVLFATTLAVVATAMLKQELAPRIALGVATVLCLAFSTAAGAFNYENSHIRAALDRTWIDQHHYPATTVLVAPKSRRLDTFAQMFWNRSLNRIALLPRSARPDAFQNTLARVTDAGAVEFEGQKSSATALLVDSNETFVKFANRAKIDSFNHWDLYAPGRNAPRLSIYFEGFAAPYLELAGHGDVWAPRPGFFSITLAGDGDAQKDAVLIWNAGGRDYKVIVKPGRQVMFRVPVCTTGHRWPISFRTAEKGISGATLITNDMLISVHALAPKFVEDSRACLGDKPNG